MDVASDPTQAGTDVNPRLEQSYSILAGDVYTQAHVQDEGQVGPDVVRQEMKNNQGNTKKVVYQ
jgi:hypothetical protein